MAEVVSREIAQQEIDKWLDFKKVSPKKRETNKDSIEALVDAIIEGTLVLKDETKVLVHTLRFPTEGEDPIKVLEYKPRLKMDAVHAHLNSVKSSDADGRVAAYIAALTTKSKTVVKAMDTEDYSIAQSIAIFFL